MLFPKTPIVRNAKYRRYVASKACFACGLSGYSQCAHANHGKGMALKTSDTETFPLCAPHGYHIGCHQQHDLCLDMTRDDRREMEKQYIERMQGMAKQEGWAHLFEVAA